MQNLKRPVVVCIFVLVAAGISAFGSESPTLTLACGVVIALTVGLLWRLGEPPALLMAVGLQLSQVVTPLLYANFLGVPLQSVSLGIGELSSAIWFALAAMLFLAVGIWCGQWGARVRPVSLLQQEARVWSPQSAFVFCIATILLAAGFDMLGGVFGGSEPTVPCCQSGSMGRGIRAHVCLHCSTAWIQILAVCDVSGGRQGFHGVLQRI